MSQKISSFPVTQLLTGEIWLEIIQRQYDDEKFKHLRISPEQLASFTKFVTLNVGIVTTPKIPIDANGLAPLPNKPYGDILFNMAQVFYPDGSSIEVTGVVITESEGVYYVTLPADDLVELGSNAVSLIVSYLGDLS
jgi:hypothetical protein